MQKYIQILGDLSGLEDIGNFVIGVFFFIIILFIFAMIASIITAIGYYKTLEKAGEDGWKSFIPIYNIYTVCKIVGINPYWILIIIMSILLSWFPLIGVIVPIVCIYFSILLNVSLARSFGKDDSFAIGLIFIPYIFYPILGLGQAKYLGARPMEDFLSKNSNNVDSSTTVPSAEPNQHSYCINCGNRLSKEDIYCSNCGTKRN